MVRRKETVYNEKTKERILQRAQKIVEFQKDPCFNFATGKLRAASTMFNNGLANFKEHPSVTNLAHLTDASYIMSLAVWQKYEKKFLGLDLLPLLELRQPMAPPKFSQEEFKKKLDEGQNMLESYKTAFNPMLAYSTQKVKTSKEWKSKIKRIKSFWKYKRRNKIFVPKNVAEHMFGLGRTSEALANYVEYGGTAKARATRRGIKIIPTSSDVYRFPGVTYTPISAILQADVNVLWHTHPRGPIRMPGPSIEQKKWGKRWYWSGDLGNARREKIPKLIADARHRGDELYFADITKGRPFRFQTIDVGKAMRKRAGKRR